MTNAYAAAPVWGALGLEAARIGHVCSCSAAAPPRAQRACFPLMAPSAPGRSGHGCAYRRTLLDDRFAATPACRWDAGPTATLSFAARVQLELRHGGTVAVLGERSMHNKAFPFVQDIFPSCSVRSSA